MSTTTATLARRRRAIERQRSEFEINCCLSKPGPPSGTPLDTAPGIPPEILHSWQRSANAVSAESASAPIDDASAVSHFWNESPLSIAAQNEQHHMIQLVKEGGLVAAISDPNGRLLWTHASGHMRKRAENLNFIAGGHWGEHTVGTNAVGLSLHLKRAVTVFSSEHYLPFVQDWVCYAAPIIHPVSGECVGALDISTTWNKHTPLGQSATAQLAYAIAKCLPQAPPKAELEVRALGPAQVICRGRRMAIPPRQLEILCLLILNPDGIHLEALHAALYGDAKVSIATLKADISHLRRQLGGHIASRPYRLSLSVWADFIAIWQALSYQKTNQAIALYRGSLLSKSQSPDIEEWRYCIDAMMDRAVSTYQSPDKLVQQVQQLPSSALLRQRLIDLLR